MSDDLLSKTIPTLVSGAVLLKGIELVTSPLESKKRKESQSYPPMNVSVPKFKDIKLKKLY